MSADGAQAARDPAAALRRAAALEATDRARAMAAYREALAAGADAAEVHARMGRLAMRSGDRARAEELLAIHAASPGARSDVIIDLVSVQTGLQAFDRAEKTLAAALRRNPRDAALLGARGQLLCTQGRHSEAIQSLEDALRLDPASVAARDTLADALLLTGGDVEHALSLGAQALAETGRETRARINASQARRLLGVGSLGDGFEAFAATARPGPAAGVSYRLAAPRWTIGRAETGQVVVFGETQTADEILLASLVPGLPRAQAPYVLAVDPHWQELAQRSFPKVRVVRRHARDFGGVPQHAAELDSVHLHEGDLVSAYIPLREFLPLERSALSDFANARPYLRPDPARVARWRTWLRRLGPGPKIGVQWREELGRPVWERPPSIELKEALSVPGLRFVNLGAPDSTADGGLGIPLRLERKDLDDLAALTAALDVVIGPPGVATYIAGGVGARTFILTPPRHWALLGTDGYPWFRNTRAFVATRPDDWGDALSALHQALKDLLPDRTSK